MKEFVCQVCGSKKLVKVLENSKTIISVEDLGLNERGELVITKGDEHYSIETSFRCERCKVEVPEEEVQHLID